jgi:hypothetical protein
MRWPFLLLLFVLLLSPPARAAEEEPALPLCLKTDTVKWWENAYCQTKTNVDDHAAPDFKKCLRQYRKSKAVPRATCKKIRWLKARACAVWQKSITPGEHRDCLRAKGFPQKVDQNYEYYFGG